MISLTDLSRQLHIEIDRSTAALRHIADMIDASIVPSPTMVEVPYRSQHDDDARISRSDCGPACIAMLLEWHGVRVTIDDISRATSMGATNAGQLIAAAGRYGVQLKRFAPMSLTDLEELINHGRPPIALIKYGDLGDHRQDMNYTGLHWIVVVGYDKGNIYINDPNYWGARRQEGKGLVVSRATFDHAWGDTLPDAMSRQALVVS